MVLKMVLKVSQLPDHVKAFYKALKGNDNYEVSIIKKSYRDYLRIKPVNDEYTYFMVISYIEKVELLKECIIVCINYRRYKLFYNGYMEQI